MRHCAYTDLPKRGNPNKSHQGRKCVTRSKKERRKITKRARESPAKERRCGAVRCEMRWRM